MFRTILGSDQVNSGKNTEINKQSYVKFWFIRKKYGAVSYLLSCITLQLNEKEKEKSVVHNFLSNSVAILHLVTLY